MSCGWGGRLLGALSSSNVKKYIGTEPSTETFKGLKQIQKDFNYIKIFGVLNTNWNKKDGGFFIHGDDEIIMKPTDFVVFDPRVPHSASEIFTNEKRLGIDFTVRKK